MKKVNIAILGASSLTAEILIKILLKNKQLNLTSLVSQTNVGKTITDVYPNFKSLTSLKFQKYNAKKLVLENDVIFCCQPHIKGLTQTYNLQKIILANKKDVKLIDLSADFRLKNFKEYKKWYGFIHPYKEYLKYWVYGLAEINPKKIEKAKFVANPGCYATLISLSVAPLFKNNLVKENYFSVSAISGISGAGRTYNGKNLALDVLENISPYKVNCHQHIPEILQILKSISANKNINFSFIPMIGNFKYGIMATISLSLNKKLKWGNINNIYKNFYQNSIFVRIYKQDKYPQIKNIVGTNFCDIGFSLNKNKLIIISVLDNLYKGASAGAVQNMNLMLKIKENNS